MATTFFPSFLRMLLMKRVVWLLPAPVRTAVMPMTGFDDLIMVLSAPSSSKSQPWAMQRLARCITVAWVTSE